MSLSVFGSQDAVDTFLYACALGDVQSVSDRIRSGVFIDAEDSAGNTSLQISSAAGHLPIVELLLRSGASVSKSNCYGWTALHQAACAGHLRVVQILIQNGSVVTTKTKYGQSLLALAASGGHTKIVSYLLALDVQWSSVESSVSAGFCSLSSFLVAAAFGQLDVLTSLLNDGNIDEKSHLTGTTALMLAAAGGHVDCCNFLTENEADIQVADCAGRFAPAYAAMLGRKIQIGDVDPASPTNQDPNSFYFEDEHLSVTDVFDALRSDDVELLGRILSTAPKLKDKETIDGDRTLLIEAASSKNARALKLLLSLECSVNSTASNSGRTALSHAVENCFDDGILMLLDAGADPTIKDLSGKSALDYMAPCMCNLTQLAIKRLCQAGLAKMAPELLSSIDGTLLSAAVSPGDVKTGGKTLFQKFKSKFSSKTGSSKSSKHENNDSEENYNSPADVFSFPCVGPFSATGGQMELDPVRVEPMTPPFDRRKLIWTDGAPDDSTAGGPPMSSSLKDVETLPPGNTVFTQRPRKHQKQKSEKPSPSRRNVPMFSLSSLSGDESTGDESELKSYLRNMKLEQYESLLKNNEINDLATFKLLTERDLRDLRIGTLDRHSLSQAISKAKSFPK